MLATIGFDYRSPFFSGRLFPVWLFGALFSWGLFLGKCFCLAPLSCVTRLFCRSFSLLFVAVVFVAGRLAAGGPPSGGPLAACRFNTPWACRASCAARPGVGLGWGLGRWLLVLGGTGRAWWGGSAVCWADFPH